MISTQRQSISQAEESICNWLESVFDNNSDEQILDIFVSTFIEGLNHSSPVISNIIEELVLDKDKNAERDFLEVIDKACYFLITHWLKSEKIVLVCQLIDIIGKSAKKQDDSSSYTKLPRRLNQLWKLYIQNGYFQHLRRLRIIIIGKSNNPKSSRVFANLLDRYPFLYSANLCAENSDKNYSAIIQKLQQKFQREYELKFSQYLTYQIRKAILRQNPDSAKQISSVPNPTLLKSRDLGIVLQSYVGSLEGDNYWDNACHFQISLQNSVSFVEFKQLLYQYLLKDLESSSYVQEALKPKLRKLIKTLRSEQHGQPLDEMLKVHTYTQLLNFLVVESADRPNHVVLIDLVSNLGAAATVGLLLKIILVCPQAQSSVEHRLSILFNHYYNSKYDQFPWLVQLLENWQVASSIYFGKLDSSILKQLLGNVIGDTTRL